MLGGDEADGWNNSVCGTAKAGRHPLWPPENFHASGFGVCGNLNANVCACGRSGGQPTEKEEGDRFLSKCNQRLEQAVLRGQRRTRSLGGKGEGKGHPI